ncbi:DNA polymerase IV [Pectinatus brassicae]|uniref:DNA polymerase IV n=1 Tax=Pectinatus brassicae TaxID=862415 RepID=A0A840UR35_9FIRM|nr:DNA polymerase IV [Pectinatus brassicae]MBB5335294.1 DNA polymerase-4 [Pectinatus brassicae]
MKRYIMHVDMDAFFASVEQVDNPELRGKPVIVGGDKARGVVCTASYEARKYGVHSAMPGIQAKRLCPQGIFLPVRHERYKQVSAEIFTIFAEFSPKVEPLSIDEAFLDISGMDKIYKSINSCARQLKERILLQTGIHASIGVAPNKFLAKIASDLKKPDGLVIIRHGQEQSSIAQLPLGKLWGVGQKTALKLHNMGYRQVKDILQGNINSLKNALGEKTAVHLWQLAQGIDEREVESSHIAKSIGNEETYAEDISGEEIVMEKFLHLAEKVGWRLRQKQIKARTISIKARTDDFTTYTRSITLPESTDFDSVLYKTAQTLFKQLPVLNKIRLLGLTGSNFTEPAEMSLFNDVSKIKQEKLYKAIDSLKNKFGENIITKAKLINRQKKDDYS